MRSSIVDKLIFPDAEVAGWYLPDTLLSLDPCRDTNELLLGVSNPSRGLSPLAEWASGRGRVDSRSIVLGALRWLGRC